MKITKNQIVEHGGNKLIAEFMELETKTFKSGILNYYYQDTFEGNWFEEGELSYNLSWDWLMPVVIKIGGTKNILGAMKILRDYSKVQDINEVYLSVVAYVIDFRNSHLKTIQDEL